MTGADEILSFRVVTDTTLQVQRQSKAVFVEGRSPWPHECGVFVARGVQFVKICVLKRC